MTLNRRSFLVGGAASAAASISTFAHAANPCSTPITWDKTYDVIVIGSGGAGLSAGIVAKEKGANAVVLEKLSIPGGNTMVSGGGLNAAVEADYKKAGIEDSPQLHTKQTMAAGDFRADPALVATLCENVPQTRHLPNLWRPVASLPQSCRSERRRLHQSLHELRQQDRPSGSD